MKRKRIERKVVLVGSKEGLEVLKDVFAHQKICKPSFERLKKDYYSEVEGDQESPEPREFSLNDFF